jgi:predicted ATPase
LSVNLDSVTVNDRELQITSSTRVRHLLPVDRGDVGGSSILNDLLRLSWITAERTGPRELLPLKDQGDHTQVGYRGEWAAGVVYWHEEHDVQPSLCMPGCPPTLFHQVRAHMQALFPGCDLRVSPIEGVSAVALRFRLDNRSDFRRPQNVGFGLSQLFPVVVALLYARPGDCLLIENPEVHLHPRAQQAIGTLAAQVANAGVQVMIETHSDHVLNGIRLATKRKIIGHGEVAIHFFGQTDGVPGSFVSPTIDADGRLDTWPDGFFDQFDAALSELL